MSYAIRNEDFFRLVGTGALADSAIVALGYYQMRGELTEEHRLALEEAASYLKQLAQGPSMLEKKELTSDTVEYTLALIDASRALSTRLPEGRTLAGIAEHSARLRGALERLLSGQPTSREEMSRLREFFTILSEHTISLVGPDLVEPEDVMVEPLA